MKITLSFLPLFLFVINISAQTVGQRVKTKTVQRAENKTDRTIDKGLGKAEEALDNLFKKKDKKTTKAEPVASSSTSGSNNPKETSTRNTNVTNGTQLNSFSDFEPGNNLLFFDDFKQDAMADFPAKWNTTGSGKVVTLDGIEGRWLDIVHNSIVHPLLDKPLPENCTIEFDLFLQTQGEMITPFIQFGLTSVKDIMREDLGYKEKFFVSLNRYNEKDGRLIEYGIKEQVVGNKSEFPLLDYTNKVLHVSMSINKTRLRLYLDKTKLIDLPRALLPEMRNNFYLANMYMIPASEVGVLVSNIRIASSEVDARSLLIKQLMEEGKAVTSDILFDVNSDIIKKESFAIINQFGEAMKNNNSLNIKITGHTDGDGTASSNVELSRNRSASVKRYLISNYSIEAARIQTDGKGASMPVSENNSAAGKAKNRRVEFTKL
ncbi:MAG: OmpA family protein [Bacteroidota bacterium]